MDKSNCDHFEISHNDLTKLDRILGSGIKAYVKLGHVLYTPSDEIFEFYLSLLAKFMAPVCKNCDPKSLIISILQINFNEPININKYNLGDDSDIYEENITQYLSTNIKLFDTKDFPQQEYDDFIHSIVVFLPLMTRLRKMQSKGAYLKHIKLLFTTIAESVWSSIAVNLLEGKSKAWPAIYELNYITYDNLKSATMIMTNEGFADAAELLTELAIEIAAQKYNYHILYTRH